MGKVFARSLAAMAAVVVVQSASALTINLTPDAGLAANSDALAAFQRAANAWSSAFSDPITVNISAGLAGTFSNSNTIGQTQNLIGDVDFDTVRNALVADALNEPSNAIVASLPTSATVTANVPTGKTFDPTRLAISRANLKAIGLIPSDSATDATITFNSNFSFDYNSSNGVSAGLIDFQSVATHEIGHALGFFSNVDDFDTGFTSDDLSVLDLFRFSGTTAVNALTFATGPRELRPGVASVLSDTAVAYAMSTGVNLGDGNQASHWKDDGTLNNAASLNGNYIGIMDPTIPSGLAEPITAADLRAFDLIGYDLVPEPTTLGLAAFGLLALRRRRGV